MSNVPGTWVCRPIDTIRDGRRQFAIEFFQSSSYQASAGDDCPHQVFSDSQESVHISDKGILHTCCLLTITCLLLAVMIHNYCCPQNSTIASVTSGPATVYRLNTAGLSVRLVAPPSSLTYAFLCSCLCLFVCLFDDLLNCGLPIDELYTPGCLLASSIMSHRYTGNPA